MAQSDFLFRGELAELDPDVAELIRHETARQERALILIPSESTIPEAVREALMSAFHNIYAEGYPLDETRMMTQQEILNYNARLPEYRRFADKRYYKGTEYADVVEALARRRAAELFATPKLPAEKLFVNVQPLSGAPANSAIFTGLLTVGDPIMGLDLLQGGHLTHGSPVARSGKQYKAFSYGVDPETERIDYDAIRALALQNRPRLIIAGYTSYPFAPDWAAFRSIADEVGAYLMADVSHVAGLIIAGVYPSPVGIADIISFTTHKTLGGPRGAVLITHRADVASKVDRAVFPGEQGGPHVNQIAALAVALRLASTEQFRALQRQTVANAGRLAARLEARGLRIPYGGTDTHMILVDCKSIVGPDGTPLSGDQAARILDLAGIVCNRNTIPGDPSALRASGIRIGTPWITQRGFRDAQIDRLGDIIADVLTACVPFSYTGRKRAEPRARIPFAVLESARRAVQDLADAAGIDTASGGADYPHVAPPVSDELGAYTLAIRDIGDVDPAAFLDTVLTSDVGALAPGESQPTALRAADGSLLAHGVLQRTGSGGWLLHAERGQTVANWLRALSDGFVLMDDGDPYAKAPGPVDVVLLGPSEVRIPRTAEAFADKVYAAGDGGPHASLQGAPLPAFLWTAPEAQPLQKTPLHGLHQALGAKMAAFAGYEMPLWYSSVSEEHAAVRKSAGIFDVTHMGVFDARGPAAESFLDMVTSNDVRALEVGQSHYTYLLDPDGVPIDDLMIYRLAADHFLIVVNSANNDQDWAWLNAVRDGAVVIDAARRNRRFGAGSRVELRDLRNPVHGADNRVDIALQGPNSKAILQAMTDDKGRAALGGLTWAGVTRVSLGGRDVIVSRTGYTGERIAYELFVHPGQAVELFRELVNAGAAPCGLAARDSLRTEAGLPLYGHELGRVLDGAATLSPADAGFGAYVRLHKPFFIGKAAFIARERQRDAEIARFRLASKGARPPHPGDPIVDARGRVIGMVTSCSIDSEGYQLGQAYLKEEATAEGTTISVFCSAARARQDKPLAALTIGDRVPVPEPAVVLSRFPKK